MQPVRNNVSKILSFSNHPTSSGFGTVYVAHLSCGHEEYSGNYNLFPDTTIIGLEIDCARCATIATQVAMIEALDPKDVHHIRFRTRFGGTYTFYKLDHTSPSNFFSIGGCYATPETDAAIARMKLVAPISPTEAA